jgi:hypothetical protein
MSVVKTLAEFGRLLDEALDEVSLKELWGAEELEGEASDPFHVGKYVHLGDELDAPLF